MVGKPSPNGYLHCCIHYYVRSKPYNSLHLCTTAHRRTKDTVFRKTQATIIYRITLHHLLVSKDKQNCEVEDECLSDGVTVNGSDATYKLA